MCKKYSGLCLYRYYFHGFGRDDLCRKWYCNQFIQSKSHEQLEINFPMICSVVSSWGGGGEGGGVGGGSTGFRSGVRAGTFF